MLAKRLGLQVCFDVSHSKLACNELNLSFDTFIETVLPWVAHLHIADARGLDGEGLQISEGEIDFHSLNKKLIRKRRASPGFQKFGRGMKIMERGF